MSSVHKPDDPRIFRKQCCSLAAEGYDVHYVVRQDGDDEAFGVKRWGVPLGGGRLRRMTRSVFDVFRKARDLEADLYHFHDPELLPAALALKVRGARVIFDSHEDVPRQLISKDWIHSWLRGPIAMTSEVIENLGVRALDGVIGATPFIAKRFADLGINAVAVNNFPILGELDVLEPNWSAKKRQVCYVGFLTEIRGVRKMVEAAGHGNVPLKMAGPFSPVSLREEVMAMPGISNVDVLGVIDRPVVAELLASSIAGIVVFSEQPNHINSQPNKLFEYMAAGIPVVASHFPMWRDLVEGENVGICVDPESPAEISGAMTRLADDLDLAEAMGRRGQTLVRERCNWQIEEKTLFAFYERLLA